MPLSRFVLLQRPTRTDTWLAEKGKPYTVRKGESLADISEKFGVPLSIYVRGMPFMVIS